MARSLTIRLLKEGQTFENRIEAKVGSLEPLRTRLGNVEKAVLDTVIESVRFRAPGNRTL
jgi:hypothetical protein